VQSNTLLAQSQIAAADSLLQKVSQEEGKMSAAILELERLGWQITSNNASTTGFKALNPTAGQQAFEQVSTAAEKGEGGAWVKGADGGPPIPSLADVKQREETLGGQIAELTKQRTEIAAKRALALQQAENFSRQADSTTGSNSTGFFIQGSNQRKEAGDAEVKMRDLDAQILPLQQQLDIAREQEQSIQATLSSIKDQVGKLQTGWQGVQKQMDQLKDFSASLVNGGGAAPTGGAGATSQPTVQGLNAIATDLNELIKAATDERAQAAVFLNDAYKHLLEAQKQAADALKDIPKPGGANAKVPEKAAWQALIEMNDPAEFKVRQAEVLSGLARLYGGQYLELAQRNAVARVLDPALKQAGVESQAAAALGNGGAPTASVREAVDKISAAVNNREFAGYQDQAAEFDTLAGGQATPTDQEAIAAVRQDFYYAWADSVANDVIGGSSQGDLGQLRVNVAHLIRMTNQYAWYLMGIAQNKQDARGRLAVAVTERKAISDSQSGKGLLPPMLPPELAEVATSQPAGGAEAASQPGTGDQATTAPAGSPGTASADSPDQAAARTAALAICDTIMNGDVDQAKTMVVEDRVEFRSLANFMKAYADFKKAAAAKFPDDLSSIAPPIADLRDQIKSAQVVIAGDVATFNNPGDKNPAKAKRVNGVWKMDFAPVDPNETTKALQLYNVVGPIYTRSMIALQSGKYKTADELKQAVTQELKLAVPNYVPPTTAPAGQ